jgi:hypothetical protein
MQELPQAQFNGWAKVEVMGHQSHIGYVKTEAYGTAVLFRIDTPELPEREYELTEPANVKVDEIYPSRWMPAGTKVRRPAAQGISVLVGAVSIYRIIPCTEAAALLAIEKDERTPLYLVDVPRAALLEPAANHDAQLEEFIEESEGSTHGEGEPINSPSYFAP